MIRVEPEARAREPVAHAAEAADDLVGDEEDVALATDAERLFEVPGRRQQDASGTDDRLAEERGDPLGADVVDRGRESRCVVPRDLEHVTGERPDPHGEGVHPDE